MGSVAISVLMIFSNTSCLINKPNDILISPYITTQFRQPLKTLLFQISRSWRLQLYAYMKMQKPSLTNKSLGWY